VKVVLALNLELWPVARMSCGPTSPASAPVGMRPAQWKVPSAAHRAERGDPGLATRVTTAASRGNVSLGCHGKQQGLERQFGDRASWRSPPTGGSYRLLTWAFTFRVDRSS